MESHRTRSKTLPTTKHAPSDDKSVYSNDVLQLMPCKTQESFETLEAELELEWSETMVNYFDKSFPQDVIEHPVAFRRCKCLRFTQ